MGYDTDPALPASPVSRKSRSTVDDIHVLATHRRPPPWTEENRRSGSLLASSGHSSRTNRRNGTARTVCTPLEGPSAGMVAVVESGRTLRILHNSAKPNREASEQGL